MDLAEMYHRRNNAFSCHVGSDKPNCNQQNERSLPRSLFKYFGHPLWPEERPMENPAFKLLETLTLKVNRPSEFNDPFEFSPVFDEPVARSDVRARLASVSA
jgi:hypothetical protein